MTIGKGQSDLEDYLNEAADKAGRILAFESHPEAGYYYLSDHFNFAKVGIPALYTQKGVNVFGREAGYGEEADKAYREKNYHRPSDEFNAAAWTFDGRIDDLKLFLKLVNGLRLKKQCLNGKRDQSLKLSGKKCLRN